jgi:sec-independent protein translocase protein TatC
MGDSRLSFLEHLEDLRKTVLKSVFFTLFASILAYFLVPYVMPHIVKPAGRLVFTSPAEAFTAGITVALYLGVFISSPYIIYQIWMFVSSGVKEEEKKHLLFFGASSFVFFLCGCLLGYFVMLPVGMKVLLSFGSESVAPMISVGKYISFAGAMTLVFGIVFELPIAILFLTKTGIVTPALLAKRRREAIVIIFIAAAILTPPDVVSQILMAVPLMVLFEISIVFSKMAGKKP